MDSKGQGVRPTLDCFWHVMSNYERPKHFTCQGVKGVKLGRDKDPPSHFLARSGTRTELAKPSGAWRTPAVGRAGEYAGAEGPAVCASEPPPEGAGAPKV